MAILPACAGMAPDTERRCSVPNETINDLLPRFAPDPDVVLHSGIKRKASPVFRRNLLALGHAPSTISSGAIALLP